VVSDRNTGSWKPGLKKAVKVYKGGGEATVQKKYGRWCKIKMGPEKKKSHTLTGLKTTTEV